VFDGFSLVYLLLFYVVHEEDCEGSRLYCILWNAEFPVAFKVIDRRCVVSE